MPDSIADELTRLDRVADLLDTRWRIPLTPIRFGIDPLLGLVPIAGDLVAATIATWIVYRAARLGTPPRLLVAMAGNVVLDTLIGAIPILGSIFDIFLRASRQNLDLLHLYFDVPADG